TGSELILWDPEAQTTRVTLSGHTSWVTDAANSPDGRWGFSGSGDHTTRLWDLQTGREMRAFQLTGPDGQTEAVGAVAFGDDGRTFGAGGEGGDIHLWDWGQPRRDRQFAPRLELARQNLRSDPVHSPSLVAVAEWYARWGAL